MAFTGKRFNSDKFKSGGLHEKYALTTWELWNHFSICLKMKQNLGRDGRKQDLPVT
jgi:hypothetical protein